MKKLLTLALSLALTATVGAASANTKLTVGAMPICAHCSIISR